MKKNIFYQLKSIQEYCLTFSCCCNAVFSKLNFTTPLKRLSNLWRQSFAFPLMIAAILMTGYTANAQFNIQGVAPVSTPKNGSEVDGNLDAHVPGDATTNPYGDLFDRVHPGISGHGLINVDLSSPPVGNVFYKPTVPASVPSTYQLRDGYVKKPNFVDKTIFTGTNKTNGNPNFYTWGAGNNANKGEIQNAGVHFSYGDPSVPNANGDPGHPIGKLTDLWCLFAGDRETTNGSAFIAFEFLQKPMTLTGAEYNNNPVIDPLTGVAYITGGSGGFISEGTEGGRTVGDKLVTIEFDGGGKLAKVFIHEWANIGTVANPIYEYVPFTITVADNKIFCTNNTVAAPVPFDVFGTDPGTYAVNQYAEGAINLTEVFGNDPCFVISTVFIMTRSSGSSSDSELYDFPGAPIQLNLSLSNLAVTCSDPVTLPECSTSEAITTAYNAWKAGFSNSGGIDPVTTNIGDFPALPTNATCSGIDLSFTYTVSDICGIEKSCPISTFKMPADTTPPVITCVTQTTPINCPATPVFTTPTATDTCDPSVAITFSDVTTPGSCAGTYSTTRTWTATDDCGNTATCSRTIVVRDVTPPVITCPTVTSPIDCPATPNFGSATATDTCDSTPTVTFSDVTTPGACTGTSSTTRTWTATDDCGNTATCSRTIVVRDVTAPVITCPTVTSPIDCPATPNFGTATATDTCDPTPTVTFADVTTPGACTGTSSTTRTWTATDDCGNTATCSRTIVVRDITPPVITCPTVTSPIDCPATPNFGTATATDTCDPTPTVTFADVTTPGACTGTSSTTRTWTATDDCGNTATCSRTIVVRDVTPPVITCPTVTSPINCPATPNFGTATATDTCDPTPTVTFADVTTPGACTGTSSTTRTWTATDDCGNTATCSRTIVVRDITPPVITCPTVTSPINCPATPSFGTATATDTCDSDVAITFADVTTPGSCPSNYSVTRTWTATDDCGNTATCSRTIAVQDIAPPVITCVADKTIECNAEFNFDPPTATDNCSTFTISIVSTVTNTDGSQTRTWKAVDACGNESTSCSQRISMANCTHIFPTQTTCTDFSAGTDGLPKVCSTIDSHRKVTNATPGVFFYYSFVTVPAGAFTIDVKQTNDGDLSKLFDVQGYNPNPNKANLSQIRLFTSSCGTVSFTPSFINNGSGARLTGTNSSGASATYIVSIKYDVKSITNASYSGIDNISTYTFASYVNNSATVESGSTGTINVEACSSTATIAAIETTVSAKTTDSAGFDAYPVPFKDQLTIKYKFDYKSDVKIEVFNAQGMSVLSKTDTNSYLDKEVTLDIKASKRQEQVYLVKVTTNRGSTTKKVMSSK